MEAKDVQQLGQQPGHRSAVSGGQRRTTAGTAAGAQERRQWRPETSLAGTAAGAQERRQWRPETSLVGTAAGAQERRQWRPETSLVGTAAGAQERRQWRPETSLAGTCIIQSRYRLKSPRDQMTLQDTPLPEFPHSIPNRPLFLCYRQPTDDPIPAVPAYPFLTISSEKKFPAAGVGSASPSMYSMVMAASTSFMGSCRQLSSVLLMNCWVMWRTSSRSTAARLPYSTFRRFL